MVKFLINLQDKFTTYMIGKELAEVQVFFGVIVVYCILQAVISFTMCVVIYKLKL
jgi:hypothetical protein